MKKKKITFDEIPAALVEIMDRLTAIEDMLRGQKEPKQKELKEVPVKTETDHSGTINADAAAKLIGKAKITLYNLVKRGQIPARKLGRNLVFLENELIEWHKNRKDGRKQNSGRRRVKARPVVVVEQPADGLPAKRKPGRKPKNSNVVEQSAAMVPEKKKRGRPKATQTSQVAKQSDRRKPGRKPKNVDKTGSL